MCLKLDTWHHTTIGYLHSATIGGSVMAAKKKAKKAAKKKGGKKGGRKKK
jgi:hypothetical protein